MNLSFSEVLNDRPQYFILKIWMSLNTEQLELFDSYQTKHRQRFNRSFAKPDNDAESLLFPKYHTIRRFRTAPSGMRAARQWKAGMAIHFSINPNTSAYFRFAPVVRCTSIQSIQIKWPSNKKPLDFPEITIDQKNLSKEEINSLARNDGFDSTTAFITYFSQDFDGTLLHWTDLIY